MEAMRQFVAVGCVVIVSVCYHRPLISSVVVWWFVCGGQSQSHSQSRFCSVRAVVYPLMRSVRMRMAPLRFTTTD